MAAQTQKGRKLYICADPQPDDLNQAGFEALTWVQVLNVGSIGEMGLTSNIVSYDELDTEVTQKQKAVSNAGDPPIEVSRNPTDPGQILLRTAGATKFNYAFKVEDADAPSSGSSNSIFYTRGVVSGPTMPGGKVQDFILERYTLGLNQPIITVNPAAQSAPTNTTLPAMSGIVQTGHILTAYEGVWTGAPVFTYQWQHDTGGNHTFTDISAATARTFTAVVGDVGNALRVVVTGTNGAGNAASQSAPSVVQIA
jgi:hypothetical protein